MKVYLASTSPRRRQLLSQAGFDFDVVSPDVDEVEREGESPRAMVKRFSLEKAAAALARVPSGGSGLLVAADTTVVSPNGKRVLNKPTSEKAAERILATLSGKNHVVLTGYAIFAFAGGRIRKRHTAVVRTSVKMRKIPRAVARDYVASGEPMDKAGAYGAQGIGMCFIESIRGSYSNVIGLPMAELVADLESKFGLKPKWRAAK